MSAPPQSARRIPPVLLGHRGARRCAHENTFAAFDLALAHGCNGFEFDVRLTADSVPIICHDPTFAGVSVAGATYEQLRDLAAPLTRNGPGRGVFSPLPTLEQVLARYSSSAVLDVELKVEGLESLTLAALRRHPPQRSYWLSSFIPEVLLRLHQLDADAPLGLICERPRQLAAWDSLPVAALFLHSRLLTPALLRELQAAGKQVFAWTINNSRRMRSLAALGIDGILSDDTQLLVQTLSAA
jgi:glycerophosphoryl diester phosphodiesterase